MQTIGERLEEARKRKGISIREAADITKIRGEYLNKFEGNSFEIGLPEIYVRGFLRTYANYLKLPGDKIIADYHALGHGPETRLRGGRMPNRELYGRMEIGSPASTVGDPTPRPGLKAPSPTPPAASAEAGAPAGGGNETNFRQSLVRGPISPEFLLKVGIWAGAALLVAVLIYAAITIIGGRETEPTTSPSTVTPTTNAQDPASLPAEQPLVLVALNAVEAKVVQEADGAVLFQGTLARGERRTLLRRGDILITARLGKDLEIEFSGQRHKLGFEGYDRVRVKPFPTGR